MAEQTVAYEDGAGYERFMAGPSRAASALFLDWLAPPPGACWLDVGCGTGVFTRAIVDSCAPASVIGIDPAAAQIDYARRQPVAHAAEFRLGDAEVLPFPAASFDVVAAALVINFIPDAARALAEMRRVVRPGGIVAGFVWDFGNGGSPGWPLGRGLRAVGATPPTVAGTARSDVAGLQSLFAAAGFATIEARTFEVPLVFATFDAFWESQTWRFAPTGIAIAALPEDVRMQLKTHVRDMLAIDADGCVRYSARISAVKAKAPG